jgi:bifunctional DNase/RNase
VLEARPSDGIALALRVPEAEILVLESVMQKVAVLPVSDHSN